MCSLRTSLPPSAIDQRNSARDLIIASPRKIGDIARAALVLTHFDHGYITELR